MKRGKGRELGGVIGWTSLVAGHTVPEPRKSTEGTRMKKTAGWLSSLAACAVVAAMLPAGGASAHVKSFDSTVTLRVTDNYVYKGRVKSEEKDCYRQREVTIYTEAGEEIITKETNNRGRYSHVFIGEKYYSKVEKVTVGQGSTSTPAAPTSQERPSRRQGTPRAAKPLREARTNVPGARMSVWYRGHDQRQMRLRLPRRFAPAQLHGGLLRQGEVRGPAM